MNARYLFAALLILVFVLLLTNSPIAQTESFSNFGIHYLVDQTFGNGGFVSTPFNKYGFNSTTILETNDNKYILVDTFVDTTAPKFGLARYTGTGQLDSTFGNNGIIVEGSKHAIVETAYLQSDDKILVAGTSFDPAVGNSQLHLMRFNSDGTIDSNFGTDGAILVSVPGQITCSEATGIAEQPDEKILLAGCTGDDIVAILRFLPNGFPDLSFGIDGMATQNVGSTVTVVDLILQNDGSILLVGRQNLLFRTIMVQFTSTGILDTTFGSGGVVNIRNTSDDRIVAAVAQSDGKIIVVGSGNQNPSGPNGVMLVRFNTDGSLDNSFGANGVTVINPILPQTETAQSVSIQSDGKIIISASLSSSTTYGLMFMRFNPDGTVDTSFGALGKVFIDFPHTLPTVHDHLLLTNGNLIAAGDDDFDTILFQLTSFPINERIFLPILVSP
ncbi:MAG: hypothetical protein AAF490_20305 [Chloroflexota bacterium]